MENEFKITEWNGEEGHGIRVCVWLDEPKSVSFEHVTIQGGEFYDEYKDISDVEIDGAGVASRWLTYIEKDQAIRLAKTLLSTLE